MTQDKPWTQNKSKLKRTFGTFGSPKKRMLIACEGEKTEPNYFNSFKISSVRVEPVGGTAITVVEKALEIALKANHNKEAFDEVWCVFDKDSVDNPVFIHAINLAKANNIKIAYSNECFELWYILHFDYLQSALSRDRYSDILSDRLGFQYEKNSTDMYDKLLARKNTAIANAERLLCCHSACVNNKIHFERFPQLRPAGHNPSTTVHWLVLELDKLV